MSGTLSGDVEDAGPAADEPAEAEEGLAAPDLDVARELGRGGMGIVWLATQRSLARPVAVKTLLPHLCNGPAAEKFEAEALITGRLEHPNIPPVHAYGVDDGGRPFLCMKLVKGIEWAKLLAPESDDQRARAAAVDFRGHLEIVRRVCEAVAYAHAHGVIHRDLKPENVMVGEFGEVLVMDWGIALEVSKRNSSASTKPRGPVGTPAYMPPEMARADEAAQGPATDVYLIGGLLYELLTGAPPHRGESVTEVLLAAKEGAIEPPHARAPSREVPELLAEVAMRALDPDPTKRYAGAAEVSQAIGEYLRNEASLKLSAAALEELAGIEASIAGGRGGRGGADDPPRRKLAAADAYAALAACIAELRQAQKLWEGNRAARDGLVRARLGYAAFAIERGDLGLAESQLALVPAGEPRAAELRGRIARALEARKREARRRRRLRALLAAAAVVIVAAAALVVKEMRRADVSEAARARRAKAVAITEGAVWRTPADRIGLYQRALGVDDGWVEGHTELARAHIERAGRAYTSDPRAAEPDLVAAAAAFDRAIALDPADPERFKDRAYVHEMQGDFPSALADYRRAFELAPESRAAMVGAAALALAERRFADAERLTTRNLEIYANDIDYFWRGMARLALGKLDLALEDATAANDLYPRDEWYHAFRALVLLAKGRTRDAAATLVAGVRICPRSPRLLPLLAYVAARRGDPEAARALDGRARAEREAYARAYLAFELAWRAACFAPAPIDGIGRTLACEQDLAALAPPEPSRGVALRRRGEERFARGETELALADADRAIADDPSDGAARLLGARCHVALDDPDAARAELELVPLLAPHLAEAARGVSAGK